jgi:transmembrane sensor
MVYLEKAEKGVYRKGELAVKSYNDDVNFLSWKTHILMFENTSLDKVIRDLEQHFGVRITITSLVKQWPTYTSQFEKPTLEEVLAELKQVLAIEYTIKDNVVTLDFKN